MSSYFDSTKLDFQNYENKAQELYSINDALSPILSLKFDNSKEREKQTLISRKKDFMDSIFYFEKESIDIVADSLKGYFNAYLKFLADNSKLLFKYSHLTFDSKKYNFFGTIDKVFTDDLENLYIFFINLDMPILDYMIPYANACVQALKENDKKISKIYSLSLFNNETYSISEIPITKKFFDIFLSSLKIARFMKTKSMYGVDTLF